MYEKSIELLNRAVADELAAVHQYMYFHFHCDDQGLAPLARMFKMTAIEEMVHIEHISDRILFLKGDVELKAAEEVKKTHDVKQMLELACASEKDAIITYNQFALACSEEADSATRKLFEALVEDEERHYGQFGNELGNLGKFGENYLALQSMEGNKSGSTPGGSAG